MGEEGRLIIEMLDEQGNVTSKYVGPSSEELKAAHDEGKCDMWCGWCYQEAIDILSANGNLGAMKKPPETMNQ